MTTVSKILTPLTVPLKQDRKPTLHPLAKNSYSHGFEAIYALENIDIKTIRPMVVEQQGSADENKQQNEETGDPQYTLDLGPAFRGWMPSSILNEPVQILELGKHIEKVLLEKNITSLAELQRANFKDMALVKGLGQGHIEDIRQKLKEYLGKTSA